MTMLFLAMQCSYLLPKVKARLSNNVSNIQTELSAHVGQQLFKLHNIPALGSTIVTANEFGSFHTHKKNEKKSCFGSIFGPEQNLSSTDPIRSLR